MSAKGGICTKSAPKVSGARADYNPGLKEKARKMVADGTPKAAVAKELGFSRQKLYDILAESP